MTSAQKLFSGHKNKFLTRKYILQIMKVAPHVWTNDNQNTNIVMVRY
jgi:hypothetical protein